MVNQELIEKLLKYLEKVKTLDQVCKALDMNEYEVLSLVRQIREQGVNIVRETKDDGIYLFNQGDRTLSEESVQRFKTDNLNQFKFIAISDTRLGSKSQQLSILNDIYKKGHDMGYDKVIHCGNISSGIYALTNIDAGNNFLDDSGRQIDYIAEVYPEIEGMETYFITGKLDDQHIKKNKINIGKRLADLRSDMIFLGDNLANVYIDKARMQVMNSKLAKTYTVSYRPQQQVDSFRSEDKPDILLFGGLLQMDKLNYRHVQCLSVPSVCATTREMNEKRYSNTVGAWYVTVVTDDKGNFVTLDTLGSPYYKTAKDDYLNAKVLKKVNK